MPTACKLWGSQVHAITCSTWVRDFLSDATLEGGTDKEGPPAEQTCLPGAGAVAVACVHTARSPGSHEQLDTAARRTEGSATIDNHPSPVCRMKMRRGKGAAGVFTRSNSV